MSGRDWDWVDPEDFFVAHVASRERSFWLDTAGARPWSGRVSYVGWLDDDELSLTLQAAQAEVRAHGGGHPDGADLGSDIFAALAAASGTGAGAADQSVDEPGGRPPGAGWWAGFFGYAARGDLPAQRDPDPAALDACWLRTSRVVVFDHEHRRVRAGSMRPAPAWEDEIEALLAATPQAPLPATAPAAHVLSTTSAAEFDVAFDEVQAQLRLGNSYETNLTFRTRVGSAADPVDVYRRLRRLSPAPYAALITHCGTRVLSSSPERFATISSDGTVETRPIKGTTPRDADPVLDDAAAARLRTDPKFVGENLMIVDLLRNDMSQVCRLGTVEVTDLMHVESYPSVHQLVTTITGRLRPEVTALGAVHALFPSGSMTGAPKRRTMQIIADVESSPRGVYAGALGWLGDDGSADLGVVIRTLVHREGVYTLGTGGGITVRSDVTEEYAETSWKARSLLRVLGL